MKRSLICLIILLLPINAALSKGGHESFDQLLKNILKESVPYIETDELDQFISSLNGYYILDVRTEEEYEISHIKDSRFVDYRKFKVNDVEDIPKDSIVIVYCSVGYRSEAAGEILISNGYKNVYNLYGGIFKWVNEGRQVFNSYGVTRKIHGYSKDWSRWLKNGEIVY